MTVLLSRVRSNLINETSRPSDSQSLVQKDKLVKNPKRRSFLVGAASFIAMRPVIAQSQNTTAAADTAGKLLAAVPSLGERSLGNATAKVVVIGYASVTCTYSAAFNETVWPGLKRDFVDTGKLRVIFREFPMNRLA